MERSVVMTVAGAAKCKIDISLLEKEGEAGMWTVFEETKEEGRKEGKEEMILAMLKEGYSYEEITKISGMTEDKVKEIEKKNMVSI